MSVSKRGLKRSAKQFGEKQGPKAYEKVLGVLREGHTPKQAAAAAGVGRTTIFDWRREDKAFAEAWEAAVDEGTDVLEQEAHRRAVEGVSRPVYQGKELVGHVQEYSDTLLILMMKGRRPERYNTDRVQHSGPNNGPIETNTEVTVKFVAAKKRKDDDE